MASSKTWQNQYIALLESQADKTLIGTRQGLSTEQSNQLQEMCKQYNEIFVELGSGSGQHLVSLAKNHPQTLCLGFELRYKRIYKTAEKASKLGLTNVKIVKTDARQVAQICKQADRVYINFPDPWDKRSWEKHRLLSPKVLDSINDLLCPGGYLICKTDHQNSFEATLEYLKQHQRFEVQASSRDLHNELPEGPTKENNPLSLAMNKTEFEQLFISKGDKIFAIVSRKK